MIVCSALYGVKRTGRIQVRVLAVGDSYMPRSYFSRAFKKLERSHHIEYIELDGTATYSPSTPSEMRVREYIGAPQLIVERMKDVEVLAVHGAPVTEDVVNASDALRLVCCARGGPVNVDVAAVTHRGIPLTNTPGKNAEAVADLTLAFLVMLARGLPKATGFLGNGGRVLDNWQGAQFMGNDLRGHTLGLIGYGQVGKRVATRAKAFGMRQLAYDPYVEIGEVETAPTLEDLLTEADYVSLHARATGDNVHLMDAHALATMKSGAFLVNTARASLVDEDALDVALASGHLAGAALDVFEEEATGRSRLLRHPNVVLTPHIGGATAETLLQGALMIAAEIERFAADEPLANVVNLPVPK
jgi:D-3-phosphoglycerate dehydrogenase / 2-oxoglutarate reductase